MSGNWPRHRHSHTPAEDERRHAHPATTKVTFKTTGGLRLVESFARGMSQPLDLILDHQLAALQLENLQVVCGKVHESLVQFMFENLVFTFQFKKIRLYCHTKSPR